MQNERDRLSSYVRLLPLTPGISGDHVAYSGLTGRVFTIAEPIAKALLSAVHHPERLVNSMFLPGSISDELRQAHILVAPDADELTLLNRLDLEIATLRTSVEQFTMIADATHADPETHEVRSTRIFNAIDDHLSSSRPARVYFHFWLLADKQLPQVTALLRAYDTWLAANPSWQAKCVTTLNTTGLVPLEMNAFAAFRKTNSYYLIYADRTSIESSPTVRAYCRTAAGNMLAAGELGILPLLHFLVSRDDVDLFFYEAFEEFMLTGVFYTLISTFNVIPVQRRRYRYELYCPIHGHDAGLAIDLRRLMSTRDRFSLFSLLGTVNTRLEPCVQRNADSILPDVCGCPLLPNGLTLTLSGGIWGCPVASEGGRLGTTCRLGALFPNWSLDPEAVARWRGRLSSRMARCQLCPECLLCGGGCPYDSMVQGRKLDDPLCPPVAELVISAVQEHPKSFKRLAGQSTRRPDNGKGV